jgi:hypothetical protein
MYTVFFLAFMFALYQFNLFASRLRTEPQSIGQTGHGEIPGTSLRLKPEIVDPAYMELYRGGPEGRGFPGSKANTLALRHTPYK